MDTGLIIAIAVAAVVLVVLLALVVPRARARGRRRKAARELETRRDQAAAAEHDEAAQRARRAEEAEHKARQAEQQAQRERAQAGSERAEAGMAAERAERHEEGRADEQLIDESERGRFAEVSDTVARDGERDLDGGRGAAAAPSDAREREPRHDAPAKDERTDVASDAGPRRDAEPAAQRSGRPPEDGGARRDDAAIGDDPGREAPLAGDPGREAPVLDDQGREPRPAPADEGRPGAGSPAPDRMRITDDVRESDADRRT